jgi:uncharacterized protein (TIGR03437 family)
MRQILLGSVLTITAAGVLAAQAPAIADGGVLNGASFVKGQAVAPGSLVSIFGTNLAASLAINSSATLSMSLNNVTVSAGGVTAPLGFVSTNQINAQIPWDALKGQQQATVAVSVTNQQTSAPIQVQVTQLAPGIFTIPNGVGNAVVVNPDGSVAAPTGSIPGLPTKPAKRGDGVFFYATGLGAVDSPIADGANSLDKLRHAVNPITVVVDGIAITPIFSGLSPQFPGVNQINFVVPGGARSGLVPIQIQTADGTLFPPTPASGTPAAVMAIE